jgi:hypothetical protein
MQLVHFSGSGSSTEPYLTVGEQFDSLLKLRKIDTAPVGWEMLLDDRELQLREPVDNTLRNQVVVEAGDLCLRAGVPGSP